MRKVMKVAVGFWDVFFGNLKGQYLVLQYPNSQKKTASFGTGENCIVDSYKTVIFLGPIKNIKVS